MPKRLPRQSGFSLVEMLVVVGIIVLVTGLVLPAVMRARKSARAAQCMNNLKELGRMVHAYADLNDDYIPIGTSTEPHCDPPFTIPQDVVIPPTWRTDWNDFISVRSTPSGALGAFLIDGQIDQNNAQLLFCPSDVRKPMKIDLKRRLFPPKGSREVTTTIQIGYSVRPERNLWVYHNDCLTPPVIYPSPMPKLTQMSKKALIAEAPERPSYNHGTDSAPAVNVCYNDGSVRQVFVHDWKDIDPKPWFEVVAEPYPTVIQNSSAMPVWEFLDTQ